MEDEQLVDAYIIERFKQQLKDNGNFIINQTIESITKADQRIRYRKYFLLAGGYVPENPFIKEIVEFKDNQLIKVLKL
jgi:hypothetical protein